MARAQRHSAASLPVSPATQTPSWSQWPLKVQMLQFNAANDMLGVLSRHVAALASARDVQALGEAQRTVVADWVACVDGAQRQWMELARVVPPEAWNAIGWRLKPGAGASIEATAGEGPRSLFEQSKLSIEMLFRPWIDAPDLEHTDEFVA
jgi:hypothetical protein